MSKHLSVVMPVHNGMPWVRDAIRSILNQTYHDFEFIVVDDGSSDGLFEFTAGLADTRIHYERLSANQGIVEALNRGVALCTGEYIARMDADDLAEPSRFEKQLAFLETHSDYGLVATDIKSFSHDADITDKELVSIEQWYNQAHTDDEIKMLLPIGNCLNHPSVMLRKSVLPILPYRKAFQYAEDYDLFVRLSDRIRMHKLQEPLLRYRMHTGQISSAHQLRQREVDARIKTDLLLKRYLHADDAIAIWGSGMGGRLMARALNDKAMNVIGFIDKADEKKGSIIEGVPVLGNQQAIDRRQVDFIVIATTLGREDATHYLIEAGFGKDQFLAVW